MKKISILLGLLLFFSVTGCGKKDVEAPKGDEAAAVKEESAEAAKKDGALSPQAMADSVEFTEEGLKSLFKNNPLTADEYEAYMLTFAKCKFEDKDGFYNYKSCPAKQISNDVPGIDSEIQFSVLSKLIKHENAIVRDRAYDELRFNEANVGSIMNVIKEEKDPHIVLTWFVRLCNSKQLSHPEVAPFVKAKLKDSDEKYREQFLYNAMPKNIKGDPEYVTILSDICQNDASEEIKNKACERLPKFQEVVKETK